MEALGVLCMLCLAAASGVVSLLAGPWAAWRQRLATTLLVGGNLVGLAATAAFLIAGSSQPLIVLQLPAPVPGAEFVLSLDPISAFFLAPILLVTLLGSVYGLEYWDARNNPRSAARLQLFYGLLTAALAVVVLAGTSVTFLLGWELMAVSAFFLVGTQDDLREANEAAWVFLAASHAATLALFVLFAVLYGITGSYALARIPPEMLSPAAATAIFLLALGGFGLKAGVVPLHFWLPGAHAMAPSHVSAVMSGVLIKTGIYGLVRITSLIETPPLWWGQLLLVLGGVSAVLGIAFALGQHDLKRLLAYSSIENIGVIVIGLGLALVGRSLGEKTWIVLGMAGGLLHVWNHALMKSLLFFGAGAVIHARHTRQMDAMGGLAKAMPWTAACFLIGSAAVCGLPPLNAFVSEFMVYLGIFQTLGIGDSPRFALAAFLAPVLALMGALAVACFVRAFGTMFLGVSRTLEAEPPHEVGVAMRLPMVVLAACCIAIGIGSPALAPMLDRVVATWTGQPAAGAHLAALAPLWSISSAAISLVVLLGLGCAVLGWRLRSNVLDWTETWGCGYAGPTARMQYTASSLAEMLVSLFAWPLRPSVRQPRIETLFPETTSFSSHVSEVVLDRMVFPATRNLGRMLFWFRLVQQGSAHVYLLYIMAIVVVLLLFGI
jgi:hydrogenase-4 component B